MWENVQKFTAQIWGGEPPNSKVLCYQSRPRQGGGQLFNVATEGNIKDDANTYMLVCSVANSWKPTQAGANRPQQNSGLYRYMPGLWLDIDVGKTGHSKQKLPPDIETALGLVLNAIMLPPTLSIITGGGLHCWWLFDKPYEIETADSALKMTRAWSAMWKHYFGEENYEIDNTSALTQLLRVPGSLNIKYTPPVRVKYHNKIETKYKVEDLAELFMGYVATPTPAQKTPTVSYGSSAPSNNELAELMKDHRFEEIWSHNKKMPSNDSSASAYDMAIMRYMHGRNKKLNDTAKWSVEKIIGLCIVNRREHFPETVQRKAPEYYARTWKTIVDTDTETNAPVITSDIIDKSSVLKVVSEMLGIRINNIVKYEGTNPSYEFYTELGTMLLPSVAVLLSPKSFRTSVAGHFDYLIPTIKASEWDKLAAMILQILEHRDTGVTVEGQVNDWLQSFIAQKGLNEWSDEKMSEIGTSKSSFIKDGYLHIFLVTFRKWLELSGFGERKTAAELGTLLRRFNNEPTVVYMVINKKRTSRMVWRIQSIRPDEEVNEDEELMQ